MRLLFWRGLYFVKFCPLSALAADEVAVGQRFETFFRVDFREKKIKLVGFLWIIFGETGSD